jgi:hypothetical protein
LPEYEKLNAFSEEELKSTIRKTIRRELDHLHLFHVPEKALILHIEHQSKIEEKLKQRMLLYAAMIYDKHPDKQLVQFVFYTGKVQSNLKTNVQLSHLKYHFPIIPLRNIPLEKFLKMNSLLYLCVGSSKHTNRKRTERIL